MLMIVEAISVALVLVIAFLYWWLTRR